MILQKIQSTRVLHFVTVNMKMFCCFCDVLQCGHFIRRSDVGSKLTALVPGDSVDLNHLIPNYRGFVLGFDSMSLLSEDDNATSVVFKSIPIMYVCHRSPFEELL